jgi:hypothetical protein
MRNDDHKYTVIHDGRHSKTYEAIDSRHAIQMYFEEFLENDAVEELELDGEMSEHDIEVYCHFSKKIHTYNIEPIVNVFLSINLLNTREKSE